MVLLAAACVSQAADVAWIGPDDGLWSNAANWSSNPSLPSSSSAVTIGDAGHTAGSVTINSGTASSQSLTGYRDVILSSGTLALGSGLNELKSDALFRWQGGALTGSTGPSMRFVLGGGLSLEGTAQKQWYGAYVDVQGNSSWSGGDLWSSGGLELRFLPGSTLAITGNNSVSSVYLENQGQFRKSSSTGTTMFGGEFVNSGQMVIDTGTIAWSGILTNSGTVTLATGTKAIVSGSSNSISAAGSMTGAGSLVLGDSVSGGYSTITGTVDLGGTVQNDTSTVTVWGKLAAAGGVTLGLVGGASSTSFTFKAGSVGGPFGPSIINKGSFIIGNGQTMVFDALTLKAGAVSISGTTPAGVRVNGAFNWESGDLSPRGTAELLGGGTWSTSSDKRIYGQIKLGGQTTWSGGKLTWIGGTATSVAIPAGATLTNSFDGTVDANVPIINQGTFIKSAGTGATQISSPLTTTGQVTVRSGTLSLIGAGNQLGGTITIDAGASLQSYTSYGPSFTLLDGLAVQGSGTFISPNSITVGGNARFAVPSAALRGTFQGSGTVTNGGGMTLSANIVGAGPVKFVNEAGMTLTLENFGQYVNGASKLVNRGNLIMPLGWTGIIAGSSIENTGTIKVMAGQSLRLGTSTLGGTVTLDSAGAITLDGPQTLLDGVSISGGRISPGMGFTQMTLAAGASARIQSQLSLWEIPGPLRLESGSTLNVNNTVSLASVEGPGRLCITGGTTTLRGAVSGDATIRLETGQLEAKSVADLSTPAGMDVQIAGGTATFSAVQHLRSLSLEAGTLTLAKSGENLLATHSLVVTAPGNVNVNDNDMICFYGQPASPLADITAMLSDGRIRTDLGSVSEQPTTLAAFDNNRLHVLTWNGQPVSDGTDFNQVLVAFTYSGDANLDGQVDESDYLNIIANLGHSGGWLEGDMDHDGVVSLLDYGMVTSHLGAGVAKPLLSFTVAVPEPGALMALPVALVALLYRRRREA